jgi:ABC-type transporter Mla maintaining outer membrane lipid asymmetry ATPase subunit MlaF
VGIGIQAEGLTKSFGSQRIWEDVTFEIPAKMATMHNGGRGRRREPVNRLHRHEWSLSTRRPVGEGA